MFEKYYSWIPNLTSKINFNYITDEINFDNSTIQVTEEKLEQNHKIFSLILNSSDQLEKEKAGYKYKARIELEKKGSIIDGRYSEAIVLPSSAEISNNTYLISKFKIQENGFIEIFDIEWNVDESTTDEGKKHKIIGIYNNIKYILHKDVHHDSKEDMELGVYDDEEKYKDLILDKFILSIKAFERQIKDDTNPVLKLDFFEKKMSQAHGYNAYLKTYACILNREDNVKIKETLQISENILESCKYMIEQHKSSKKMSQDYLLAILGAMTIFLPSLIASLNFTSCQAKIFFTKPYEPFIVAIIYTLGAIFIGYYYTTKKATFTLYYYFALRYKNKFMVLRNKFASDTFLLKFINLLIYFLLLVSLFLIIISYKPAFEFIFQS